MRTSQPSEPGPVPFQPPPRRAEVESDIGRAHDPYGPLVGLRAGRNQTHPPGRRPRPPRCRGRAAEPSWVPGEGKTNPVSRAGAHLACWRERRILRPLVPRLTHWDNGLSDSELGLRRDQWSGPPSFGFRRKTAGSVHNPERLSPNRSRGRSRTRDGFRRTGPRTAGSRGGLRRHPFPGKPPSVEEPKPLVGPTVRSCEGKACAVPANHLRAVPVRLRVPSPAAAPSQGNDFSSHRKGRSRASEGLASNIGRRHPVRRKGLRPSPGWTAHSRKEPKPRSR